MLAMIAISNSQSQTHRTLDSNNAKKCTVCGKMYVSMPALSMHVLTHNLSHKCR